MRHADGEEQRQRPVVERRERERHGQKVEPREIPAEDKPRLRQHDHRAGDGCDGLRCEEKEGHDELGEEVAQDLDAMERPRQVMEEPAERVGHRLGLVVVVEARQLAPAPVAAQLDESGAELDPEDKPAEQEDERPRGHRAARAEEDREKAGLEQERLPAERVKDLADIDDRLIQHPQREPDDDRHRRRRDFRQPDDHGDGEENARPGDDEQQAVGVVEVKEARRLEKPHAAQEPRHRQQSLLAEQRAELERGDEERDEVDRAQRPLDHQPRQPVVGCLQPVHVSEGAT